MMVVEKVTPAGIASAVESNPMPQGSASGGNPHDNDSMAFLDVPADRLGTSADAVGFARVGWAALSVIFRDKRPILPRFMLGGGVK